MNLANHAVYLIFFISSPLFYYYYYPYSHEVSQLAPLIEEQHQRTDLSPIYFLLVFKGRLKKCDRLQTPRSARMIKVLENASAAMFFYRRKLNVNPWARSNTKAAGT